MTAASGADQRTLRDQLLARLLTEYRRMWNPAELHEIVDDLLPLIEADRERAKAEGGAAVARVLELHQRIDDGVNEGFCDGCEFAWPCPTVRAVT